MKKSDRPHLSGAAGSTRAAVATALLIMAVVLATALFVLLPRIERSFEALDTRSDHVATSIAESVAADVHRAIGLGIPLDAMRGVEPYLDNILSANPSVAEIRVLDPTERTLYAAGEPGLVYGAHREVRAAISGESLDGTIVVVPSRQMLQRVHDHIVEAAIAIAIAAGIAAGVFYRIVALERRDLPQARFVVGGRAVSHGVFADFSAPRPGPFQPLGQAAARLTVGLRRGQRRLQSVVDEVRALDVTHTLHERIGAALAPLSAYRFDRPFKVRRLEVGFVWWPLLLLTMAMATRPLATNFAEDRVGDDPILPLVIAATMAASGLGGLFGLLAARLLGGRLSKLVTLVATLAAAIAIGSTFILRDVTIFIATNAVAGFGVWFAAFTVLLAEGAGARRPWRAALVFLAAAAIGPAFGGLIAESVGRRFAFLTIGVLLAIVALASTAGAPRRVRRVRTLFTLGPSETFALAAAAMTIFTWSDLYVSAAAFTENYATMAMHFAILGAASFVPVATGARPPALFGAALAAAALAAAFLIDLPAIVATVSIGLGFGFTIHALGARGFGGTAAAIILAALVLTALCEGFGYPLAFAGIMIAIPVAGLLVLLSLLTALASGRARRTRGHR
ncbi:hypothetical protein L1787_19930 [Acuticoccus sp. M5D2P5]|uniref:hypothetical protein n=1 Tax=Acuticoccus kalidii TaxID=2910977 RepID=UPI001F3F3E47|nr:hypothetical protein [Acuticoccus kalidii]MCF3935667.1 hypothetical protein [Acuticoccus kalidii]